MREGPLRRNKETRHCSAMGSHTNQLRKELMFRKAVPSNLHLGICFPLGKSFRFFTKHAFLFEGHSVQLLSCVQLFSTPWTAARQVSLSITDSRSLLKLMSELVMPPNHLILCCPLLLLPSIFPSTASVLCIRWPKYWSFCFSISPSNEYSGLISFRMDWLDLLAVQGTLESSPAPQCKSINSSVLSFLYLSTLTSIYDYWKDHSFDYMDLCRQSNVSAF